MDALLDVRPSALGRLLQAGLGRSGAALRLEDGPFRMQARWGGLELHTDFPGHRPYVWLTLRFRGCRVQGPGLPGSWEPGHFACDDLAFTSRVQLDVAPIVGGSEGLPARVGAHLAAGGGVLRLGLQLDAFGGAPWHPAASSADGQPIPAGLVPILQHLLPAWLRGHSNGTLLFVLLGDGSSPLEPSDAVVVPVADGDRGAVGLVLATGTSRLPPDATHPVRAHALRPKNDAALVLAASHSVRRTLEDALLPAIAAALDPRAGFSWQGGGRWSLHATTDYVGHERRLGMHALTEEGHVRVEALASLRTAGDGVHLDLHARLHIDRLARVGDRLAASEARLFQVDAAWGLRVTRGRIFASAERVRMHDHQEVPGHPDLHGPLTKTLHAESVRLVRGMVTRLKDPALLASLRALGEGCEALCTALAPVGGGALRIRGLGMDRGHNLIAWTDFVR